MQPTRKQFKIYIDRSPDDVWAFFTDFANYAGLMPAEAQPEVSVTAPHLQTGARLILRGRHPVGRYDLTMEIVGAEPESLFEARQVTGPFAELSYRWNAIPFQAGTLVTEQIEYVPGGGFVAPLIDRFWLSATLDRLLLHRQQAAKRTMESLVWAE